MLVATINNKAKAFSLIELMVVIAIVAILAAVAVPVFRDYKARAQVMKAITVQDDMNDKLIEAYNQGKWTCGTTTSFSFAGGTYTVDAAYASVAGYSSAVDGIAFASSYGSFGCSNSLGVTSVQVANLPSTSGGEMICRLVLNSNSTITKKCGVWGGFSWQVSNSYLPSGWDCILSTDLTLRGTACGS